MASHARRRSVSSSSSSSSSSPGGNKYNNLHTSTQLYGGTGTAPTGARLAGDFSGRDLYSDSQQHRAPSMSGPGFPNSPPPSYDSPPYGGQNQEFIRMPGEQPHFAPPAGPPPSFHAAHGPGFPAAELDKPGYNAPDFPTSPQDAPRFPLTIGGTTESRERGFHLPGFPHHGSQQPQSPPPSGPPPRATPPPSGYRVPLTATAAFPVQQAGQPVTRDLDGSPVFIGSALLERSVHPCKIVPNLQPPCRVPYGGGEFEHQGRFDLLPFDPQTMEWVPTSQGRIPAGRRPVDGGYEEHGGKLYHALGVVQNVEVPGKTGEHLVRASVHSLLNRTKTSVLAVFVRFRVGQMLHSEAESMSCANTRFCMYTSLICTSP